MASSVEGLIKWYIHTRYTLTALEEISAAPCKKKPHNKNLNLYRPHAPDLQGTVHHVLLFQFLDGELKTAHKKARKLPDQLARLKKKQLQSSNPSSSQTDMILAHDLQTPSYSPKMMIKMVEKRNLKFKEAVDELLEACAAENPPVDPAQLLIECAIPNNPIIISQNSATDSDASQIQPVDLGAASSTHVPTIEKVLEQLKASSLYRDQIVENGQHVTPARPASFQDLQHSQLSPQLSQALQSTKGITRLYSHQARAIDLLAHGSNVIVTTSTSSGKSLIYQIPMLQALESTQSSCGLYIFPTKALAQDQKRSLEELILSYGEPLSRVVGVETYDGDTPQENRAGIRKNANVIFTNPDMLHSSILPYEELWRRFFRNLKFVVVDELHIYAGLFGSHVAMIMRRLRRVCEAVENPSVRFISCSATTINPQEHMKTLFGFCEDVELVSEDGAPAGAKRHVVWNPPLIDNRDPAQGRVSAIVETSKVLRFLMERNIRTIVFCRIRKTCELLMKQVQEDLVESGRRDMKGQVRSYRAGYTTQERRLIEAEMFSGQLTGIIATTALELGIDIGGLDAVISLGFPHSLSGLIQQAGRAGRRSKESLAMLILEQRGLDQHYASHPDELFGATGSSVSLDLHSPRLLFAHLQCAAHEVPVVPESDRKFFGPTVSQLCSQHLARDEQGFYHSREPHPSQLVSIRGLISTAGVDQDTNYTIVDMTDPHAPHILEEIQQDRVLFECFEGAIFLHQGRSLLVLHLDHPRRSVSVRNALVHYLTQPILRTTLLPHQVLRHSPILPASSNIVFMGKIQITTTITGYLKVDSKDRRKVLDRIEMPLSSSCSGPSVGSKEGEGDGAGNVLSTTTNGLWIHLPHTLVLPLLELFKQPSSSSPAEASSTSRPLNTHELSCPTINRVIHLLEHLLLAAVKSPKNTSPHLHRHDDDDNDARLLKTSCAVFKAYSSSFSSSSSDGMDDMKLMERILVYEDPKKSLEFSICSPEREETVRDECLDRETRGHRGSLLGIKFAVQVLANGLLDRVWVPEDIVH
ncbi:hypothetical protein VP01_947g10 [Puccinia sorghi]|uniref:P-loop containing nucleoside triphosphate hydrolase protein n=1 Tax=Puccinia sorghi TaxID=27349 RepID=A0A0L6U6J3_9BASI|nr:hypothetical protein VP01_947g10 [Puccinia sorghi]